MPGTRRRRRSSWQLVDRDVDGDRNHEGDEQDGHGISPSKKVVADPGPGSGDATCIGTCSPAARAKARATGRCLQLVEHHQDDDQDANSKDNVHVNLRKEVEGMVGRATPAWEINRRSAGAVARAVRRRARRHAQALLIGNDDPDDDDQADTEDDLRGHGENPWEEMARRADSPP